MVQEIMSSGLQLTFDAKNCFTCIEAASNPQNWTAPINDALLPELPLRKTLKTAFWWCLEVLPLPHRYQDGQNGQWHLSYRLVFFSTFEYKRDLTQCSAWLYRPHLGKRRTVPSKGSVIHDSVQRRMASDIGYRPRAMIPHDAVFSSR